MYLFLSLPQLPDLGLYLSSIVQFVFFEIITVLFHSQMKYERVIALVAKTQTYKYECTQRERNSGCAFAKAFFSLRLWLWNQKGVR